MYEFTPKASWTTMTAPRASPSGRASYSDIGPSVVSSSRVRVSTDAPSVLGGRVEGGAQLGDEPARLFRSVAGQHPPHERAPDYHTVGGLRSRHRLLRRRDPHAEQDGHVAGRLAAPAHLDRLTGEGRSLAGRGGLGHALRRRGAEPERPLRRLLDRATVHHRVGERDPDLDGVGTGVGGRSHHVDPTRAETTGDVRREQGASGVASLAQVRLEPHASCSPVTRSATWTASLSPRPDSVTSTVEPAGTDRPASRASHATAWAGSSAGTIPSVTDSSSKAATASSSVA